MPNDVTTFQYSTMLSRIAREIAIELYDIETILNNNQITLEQFNRLKEDPQFLRILESEISAWNAAGNTYERSKIKAGALIEEFLIEANQRLHDRDEPLSAKNELLKTLARIAGMGERTSGDAPSGARFTVTINLGADHNLRFENAVTPKVIEHEEAK